MVNKVRLIVTGAVLSGAVVGGMLGVTPTLFYPTQPAAAATLEDGEHPSSRPLADTQAP